MKIDSNSKKSSPSAFSLALSAAITTTCILTTALANPPLAQGTHADPGNNDNAALRAAIVANDFTRFMDLMTHSDSLSLNAGRSGFTPLMLAVHEGRLPMVARLIHDSRVSVSQGLAETGDTPLHIAIYRNNPSMVGLLLTAPGILPNQGNVEARTPLIEGIVLGRNHSSAIRALLRDARVDVNQRGRDGATALHWAARLNSEIASLRLLLRHPNIQKQPEDSRGYTPLHYAIETHNPPATRALIEASELGLQALLRRTSRAQSPYELALQSLNTAQTEDEMERAQKIAKYIEGLPY